MSALPDEVIEEAVKAATLACENAPVPVTVSPLTYVRETVEAAAPVIAKAERDRVKARIEAVRTAAPSWPDDDSYEAGLDAALSAIEGENNE